MNQSAKHPLVTVRRAIGMSQPGFAKFVGVSMSTITSVETGRMRLSESLAKKIMVRTGVLYLSLMLSSYRAVDCFGRAYSRKSYDEWKATREGISEEKLRGAIRDAGADLEKGPEGTFKDTRHVLQSHQDEDSIARAGDQFRALQKAAGIRLLAIQMLFDEFRDKVIKDYGIESDFQNALRGLNLPEDYAKPLVEIDHIEKTDTRVLRRSSSGQYLQYFPDRNKK